MECFLLCVVCGGGLPSHLEQFIRVLALRIKNDRF